MAEMERYFEGMEEEAKRAYEIAAEARKKGLDPELATEIPLAKDLAGRVEGLVGPPGVAERIRQLSSEFDKEEIALRIAREIAEGRFGAQRGVEEACDQALRTSLAILTEGIVAAPIEGIVRVRVKKNGDGSSYLAVYFAGPIRSAGGSEQALVVLTADYVRRILGLDRYKPTEEEVERFVEELELYNNEVVRLQYMPTSQDIRDAVKHIPIEITGESTDKIEVSGYRDLERIETNQVRGGGMLVLAGGVLQKKRKIRKYVEKFKLEGWEWMLSGAQVEKKGEEAKPEIGPSYTYIKELIAGRPVLSHPSAKGGLRLRYGRSRNSGYAATCLHPATLALLDDFIAIGTQIKTERPGKGSAIGTCDSIEGPLARLADGSVVRIGSAEEAAGLRGEVKEILFLGDILVNYGDFLENNHVLMPSGYVEEWWEQELNRAGGRAPEVIDEDAALAIAKEFKVPLHPRYTYYYHDVEKDDLRKLAQWLSTGRISEGVLILRRSEEKRTLELLGVQHKVKGDEVAIREYKCLLASLGMGEELSTERFTAAFDKASNTMELVNSFGIVVRQRAPTYIGARMGRPEKAKERTMKPAVNVLFPVGQAGGRTRDVRKAAQAGRVEVEVARRECPKCGSKGITTVCPKCGTPTAILRLCLACNRPWSDARERCKCGGQVTPYEKRELDVKAALDTAVERVGDALGDLKGVIGMSSELKIPEALEKGILRSKHGVFTFKDGTARFDSTDMPLTHFTPREVGVSVARLIELGYDVDHMGRPLESDDQLLELKCQDIVLADAGAEYLLRVSKFVDDLLAECYGLKPYYNAKSREDLLGHLVLGLAPHTSAAILGRIIGFTQANVGYAHPYFHAAKRRNCLHGSSEILVLNDGHPKLVNLEHIYNETHIREQVYDRLGAVGKGLTHIHAVALNPKTGKFEVKKIKSIMKVPAPLHLVQIKTKSGRQLIASPDHRMPVFSGALNFKKVVELCENDKLLTPMRLENFQEFDIPELDLLKKFSEMHLREEFVVRGIEKITRFAVGQLGGLKKASVKLRMNKKTLSNYIYRDSIPISVLERLLALCGQGLEAVPKECRIGVKRNAISIPRVLKIDGEFMRLLGYYIAEGHSRAISKGCYQVCFAASEEEIRKDISNCIEKVFGKKPNVDDRSINIPSRAVYHLFVDILQIGKGAKDKRIPSVLLALPKFKIRDMLRAYFAGDGSVEKNRLHVSCSSVNSGLLRDIGFLLLRFGIYYRIKHEKKKAGGAAKKFYQKKGKDPSFELHYLSMTSTYAKKFCKNIGIALSRKQESLEAALIKERKPRIQAFGDCVIDEIKEVSILRGKGGFLYDIEVEDHHNFLTNDFLVSANCDGDEDSVFLLMDALLNFSKSFLPTTRGGKMDAPLVLTTRMDPREVDDEAHNIDVVSSYPLEFYEATLRYASPKEVKRLIETVSDRLGSDDAFKGIGFTHATSDIALGPRVSTYKTLATMMEKAERQLALASRVRAVDPRDVAKRVVESHFLPDLAGNLRTFSKQTIRCVGCNAKYRRVPLSGKCRRCGGKLLLTVSKGGVEKYLDVTKKIIDKYALDDYLRQRVQILEASIASVFVEKGEKQVSLSDF